MTDETLPPDEDAEDTSPEGDEPGEVPKDDDVEETGETGAADEDEEEVRA